MSMKILALNIRNVRAMSLLASSISGAPLMGSGAAQEPGANTALPIMPAKYAAFQPGSGLGMFIISGMANAGRKNDMT
jgi:hypothetical protein